jgi:hypothetical protein
VQLVQTNDRVVVVGQLVSMPEYVDDPCGIAMAVTVGGFETAGVRPPPAQPTGA